MSVEEFPLVLPEEVREDALDEVKAIGETVSLEEGASDFSVRQLDKAVRKLLQLLLGARGLRPRFKSSIEKLDEGRERELVHVIHLEKVAEDHEQIAANH